MPHKVHFRRKRLSMASLIDIIFLLLLFFMLSSTFSRFAEVEISASGTTSTGPEASDVARAFLRISATGLTLNGQPIALKTVGQVLSGKPLGTRVLVSTASSANAQALTGVLVTLRALPDLDVILLE